MTHGLRSADLRIRRRQPHDKAAQTSKQAAAQGFG
jgi:hypothetical protein